jgi:uncharacterized protein (TIGR03437 family)
MRFTVLAVLSVWFSYLQIVAATFGTVVVTGGHASDLAFDARRGQLYVANFAGRRIDVIGTADNTLRTPIRMDSVGDSGSIALSQNGRYLVVANYDSCANCDFLTGGNSPSITVLDLDGNVTKPAPIPAAPASGSTTPAPRSPLTVAFGNGNQALLVTNSGIFLVDPAATPVTFTQLPLPAVSLSSSPLPIAFATFPPQIIQASSTVSADGQVIFVLASGGAPTSGGQILLRYEIGSGTLSAVGISSAPALGPRVVSADRDGSNVLAGWSLLNRQIVQLAEFPYPTGVLNLGGHAWDSTRNQIYAQIPTGGPASPPLLHIVDTDNLTVRERIQLPENLGGKAVFSSDMNTLYAISDSGVTVLPIGSLESAPRVSTREEQLLFTTTSCESGPIRQTLNVMDLGGGRTDFTLSVPANTRGVRIGQTSGSTPAQVTIEVDPSAFRSQTGTSVVSLDIQSNGSVGITTPVRLLINTKDPDQRGIIHSLPGKIVDLMADSSRRRMYAIRQDRNQVLVMEGSSFNPIAVFRTGNTPTKMVLTRDNRYMIVGNDHSQIANVFDLETLQATPFIVFPGGHYPRTPAISNSQIFTVVRNAGTQAGLIDRVDFANRVATTPSSLGIYTNNVPPDSTMTTSPSGGSIFTAMSDGTVLLFDDTFQAFEASRKDVGALSGSYAAISDDVFFAGGTLFNRSMVPMGTITGTSTASSVLILGNQALTINADSSGAPGVVERVPALSATTARRPLRSIEAPLTKTILTTPTVGQIGQTILPFLQTVVPGNDGTIIYLSVSGFTELPATFEQALPVPLISSIVNSADGGAVAPGSLIVVSGSGLSPSSGVAGSLPLPTSLAEICALANNVPVPLIQVSSTRIDAQLPYEVLGSANFVVIGPSGKSAPFSFTAPATAPAIFRSGRAGDLTGLPLIYRASNNELLDFSNPIHPGDTIIIVATGLGRTSPAAVSGAAAPSDPLEVAAVIPTVALGNTQLQVSFAGLMPGIVGIYQINATVPSGIGGAPQMSLVIQQGNSSTTFTVRVVNP